MRLAVVVHVDELWLMMLHDFRHQDSVGKVARNVTLGPTQRNLIYPVVDGLQVVFRNLISRSGLHLYLTHVVAVGRHTDTWVHQHLGLHHLSLLYKLVVVVTSMLPVELLVRIVVLHVLGGVHYFC